MKKSVKKKKKFQKLKKNLSGFLALVLVVGLTVAGTLAYLSAKTNNVTNTFTASGDIKLLIDEPNYYYTVDDNGVTTTPRPSVEGLKPDPKHYVPGTTYDKDPTLYNISGSDSTAVEWVAMRVDFQLDDSNVAESALVYNSSLNTNKGIIDAISYDGNWFEVTESVMPATYDAGFKSEVEDSSRIYKIFIYKYPIEPNSSVATRSEALGNTVTESISGTVGTKTRPLFSSITIKDQADLITSKYASAGELPEFKITTKGAAIKMTSELTIDSTITNNYIDTSKIEYTSDTNYSKQYEIVKALWDLLKEAP